MRLSFLWLVFSPLTTRGSACIVGNIVFHITVVLLTEKRNAYEPEDAIYHA